MKIENSTNIDIDEIFRLYKIATDFQKTKSKFHWAEFEKSLVEIEINENRQWKIIINDEIACVWAITFGDPLIWGERSNDPSVYIHRIATNPKYRGNNLVMKIIEWARQFAKTNDKKFVRMDTVGENKNLIDYYKKCGFNFLGLSKLTNTVGLPSHYHKATVSLFELKIN